MRAVQAGGRRTSRGARDLQGAFDAVADPVFNSPIATMVEATLHLMRLPRTPETDQVIRLARWKLNLTKYVFGVPSGKLLGFILSHRGIEANPKKNQRHRGYASPSNN